MFTLPCTFTKTLSLQDTAQEPTLHPRIHGHTAVTTLVALEASSRTFLQEACDLTNTFLSLLPDVLKHRRRPDVLSSS